MSIAGLSLISGMAVLVSQSTIEDYGKELATIDRIERALPIVVVRQDDVRINRSCVVRMPPWDAHPRR